MPASVEKLNLARCGVTAEGMQLLCEGLKTNTTLQKLLMFGNNIGDEGARHIADMLLVNKSLRVLYPSGCHIGQQGYQHLARSLAENDTLRCLSLINNPSLTDDHVRSICEGLKVNRGIENLRLNFNSSDFSILEAFSTTRQKSVVECLRVNFYIKELHPDPTRFIVIWGEYRNEIQYLLTLNKLNRKIIADEQARLVDWLSSVIEASRYDDVSFSYFFIRNNPRLCMYSARNSGA